MLFHGVRLVFINWRLTLVQVLPAMWVWLAMLDLKAHTLHGRSFHVITGPIVIPIVAVIAAITAAAFFLNAVFAFAIARPGPPDIRAGFAGARGHLPVVLGSGAVVGLALGLSTVVVTREGSPWFALSLSVVIGVMMVCYVAVPSSLIGVKATRSRRDKVAATAVSGALGAAVSAPAYVLGRVGLLMLGSSVLFVPAHLRPGSRVHPAGGRDRRGQGDQDERPPRGRWSRHDDAAVGADPRHGRPERRLEADAIEHRSGDVRRSRRLAGTVRITAVEAIPFALPYRRAAGVRVGQREQRGQRARARAHGCGAGRSGRGAAAPVHLRRDAGVDRRRGRRAARRGARRVSTRCALELVAERCARRRRQLCRARRGRSRRVGPRRADPRLPVPHAARWVRGRRRRGAHGLLRRAGARWREEAVEVQRAARGHDLQGQGRARSGAGRRGGPRDPRGPAGRRSVRRRQPGLELRRRGAGRRRARRAGGAGDRGADLGRGPRRPAAAGGALGGAAGRRRELHQPRARRPRARGGRGAAGEREDGADRVHGVAPDPRPLPRRATCRWWSAASTRARSAPRRRSRSRRRSPRPRAGRRRSRTSSTWPTISSSPAPEIRDGRAAVAAAPGLGFEVDEERLQRYRLDR